MTKTRFFHVLTLNLLIVMICFLFPFVCGTPAVYTSVRTALVIGKGRHPLDLNTLLARADTEKAKKEHKSARERQRKTELKQEIEKYNLLIKNYEYQYKNQAWQAICNDFPALTHGLKPDDISGLKRRAGLLDMPGDVWTEPVTGMEFVWLPKGCFEMGQTNEEKNYLIKEVGRETSDIYFRDALPRHRVCVDGFWMGRYEVTKAQFRKFVKTAAYKTDAEKKGKAWILNESTDWQYKEQQGYFWDRPGFNQQESHPVVCVSWNDAKAFAAWLGKKTGTKFDLPAEAQWEYAARAGTTGMGFWRNDDSKACIYANILDKESLTRKGLSSKYCFPCDDHYFFTSPAGTYKANAFGLYDMLGNVWEWCEDVYVKNAYSKHGLNNPVVESGGSLRVIRGGSWFFDSWYIQCASRYGNLTSNTDSNLGFRLIRKN